MRLRRSHTDLYLHFTWGTWDRLPLITPDMQQRLYANIAHQAASLDADVITIGGIADHVHLLVRYPTTISIAEFTGRVKGASSHFVTHVLRHPEPFKWQGGYGAFTVSRRGVPTVRDYVLTQEEHHRSNTLFQALERVD